MIRQTARPRRRASRLASVVVATALAAAGAFVAAQPASAATDGVVSVTPITQVSTYGQRVTAVALEFDGLVDPASVDPDGFRVEDTGYNFRFNSIDELDDLVDREITRAYTNSAPALRGDGSSMEGSYVVLELSDDSPGGWTVITAVNPRYVRINPDQPTQVFQLADVQGLDGSVLSTARPDAAWPLTRPAVNLEVDEFEHGVFRASTGTDVPYDFRLPEGYDPTQEYPLVVILPGHGMGSNGTNDRVQIVADIPATAWFQPEWTGTDEKVAVLAIQSVRNATEVAEAVELVRSFMGSHAIDADRVYASSVSWGSRLIWGMASTHPDLFAGALLTGGFPPDRGADHRDHQRADPVLDHARHARPPAPGGQRARTRTRASWRPTRRRVSTRPRSTAWCAGPSGATSGSASPTSTRLPVPRTRTPRSCSGCWPRTGRST